MARSTSCCSLLPFFYIMDATSGYTDVVAMSLYPGFA
jgi:hypothetical protein